MPQLREEPCSCCVPGKGGDSPSRRTEREEAHGSAADARRGVFHNSKRRGKSFLFPLQPVAAFILHDRGPDPLALLMPTQIRSGYRLARTGGISGWIFPPSKSGSDGKAARAREYLINQDVKNSQLDFKAAERMHVCALLQKHSGYCVSLLGRCF